MLVRERVTSATVYVNAVTGNDANDGATPATALLTIQRAFDYAAANFDLAPPFAWGEPTDVGMRSGVTIQMAENSPAQPYLLPSPSFLDGLGCSGPITLLGDSANPMNYCIMAENSLQGLTAQHGAVLVCRGFRIWSGVTDCTAINALEGGNIYVDSVTIGGGQMGGAIGAAGGSQVHVIGGGINLVGGSGFVSVLEAIEQSKIEISAPITFGNAMNFGAMLVLSHSEASLLGIINPWASGVAGSDGQSYRAYRSSFLGFDHTLIPGTAGESDATSVVL